MVVSMGKIMIRDGVGYSRTFSKRVLQQIMAVLRPMFIFVCIIVHYPLDIYQSLVSSSSGSLLSDLTIGSFRVENRVVLDAFWTSF